MWKLKRKALGVERISGHAVRRSRLIVGRPPGNSEISFTLAELYGAMAQCSSRVKLDQRAARAHVEFCRYLIARHVDEKNDRFALLDTVRDLKDYVGKAMTGLVGDGVTYLQMARDGYRWIDHFENHDVLGTKPTTRSPDFIFSRSDDNFVALTESKATKGTSKGAFDKTVQYGYLGQVEPYLGRKIGPWIASHGFAVGSWMTSVKKAEIFVHHTATSDGEDGDGPDDTSDPSAIRFGSYCGVVSLLFGPDVGEAARNRSWRPSEQAFTTAVWLDRTWIVGEELAEPVNVGIEGQLIFKRAAVRIFNGMALDWETAMRVFAYLEAAEPEPRLLDNLPEFSPELRELAQQAGGAIFPDGFAVLGRAEDLMNVQPQSLLPSDNYQAVIASTKIGSGGLVKQSPDLVARLALTYEPDREQNTEDLPALVYLMNGQ